jgi:SAM-dependent methyltransferase
MQSWDSRADQWIPWARAPGLDAYWRYHRDAFLPLVPPPGRLTLEIGCGEGRVLRDLAQLGHRAVGIDNSKVLTAAAKSHPGSAADLVVADAALLPFEDGTADCVVAFMSLQDIQQMEQAVIEAGRVLAHGGRLVVAITHPLNTAGEFAPGPVERDRPFVVDGSWFERRHLVSEAEQDGFTMTFELEHRSLQTYTDALAAGGFLIERIRELGEPDPGDKWSRMPLFLHVRAVWTEGATSGQL